MTGRQRAEGPDEAASICTSRETSAIKRQRLRGNLKPRVLSKGAVTSQKKKASHRDAARADTVPRPRKERAVPTAGQPLMAEPDFGRSCRYVGYDVHSRTDYGGVIEM